MVARLLRLRLDVLLGAFRSGPGRSAAVALGFLVVVGATAGLVAGLDALRASPLLAAAVVAGGAMLSTGFLLLPALLGPPDPMDPRALRLFGIPSVRLAAALALAGLVSVPVLALVVVGVAMVPLFPGAGALAVVGPLLGILTAALFARIGLAASAALVSSRTARELLAVLGLVLLLAAPTAWGVAAILDTGEIPLLERMARALALTPFGAAWAIAPRAAAGEASGPLLVALATLAGAAVLWWLLVHRLVSRPERTHRPPRGLRLGWFDVLGGTRTGAIAARSITYWVRDPRYRASLVAVPLLPVVAITLLALVGVPFSLLSLLPVPLVVLFLGWFLHNDTAYDGSAFWLHVAAGVRGVSDRLGRAVPTLLLGLPLVLLGSLVSSTTSGRPDALPVLLAVNSCLLLVPAGVASVVSARLAYPAPRPGDSAFVQPQAPGASGAGPQALAFGLGLLLSAPAVVLAVRALFVEPEAAGDAVLVGLGSAVVVFALGVLLGGWVFERRATQLVAFTSR
ncbi:MULTISPECIES: ABC transporter permease [unclassified Rathayibacter]|uniref:ABC transporter permease n=1 Tax=unclassified Rathayibacter TaxID=2609250 RepID=UPI00188B3912|nr:MULTISPECIES: ABC transporter permease [unclassified Rathayibacter]MBF4462723.1 ABC transporter permease [Rathayibacter sp. VKM Ac-2879]MBF4504137.1 ABC transporter permease [Rathayibacter sp. VKM Ac-2878]